VSAARLSLTPGRHVRDALKTSCSEGTTHLLLELLDFLARWAALAAQTARQSHSVPRRARPEQRPPDPGDQGRAGQGCKRPGSGRDRRHEPRPILSKGRLIAHPDISLVVQKTKRAAA